MSTKEQKPEQWLTVKEIAEHLKVSKETIYNFVNEGTIPAHKVGRVWRFKASEVDTWVINSNNKNEKDRND
jgi:excisionase family DNA binding protein